MIKKKIKDLRFLIEIRNQNFQMEKSLKSDIVAFLDIIEKPSNNFPTKEDESFILRLSEKALDFLLKKPIDVYSQDVIKKFYNLILDRKDDLKKSKKAIERNSRSGLVILNQHSTINEATKTLSHLTRKVEEYKENTPDSYNLSRKYFEDSV